MSKPRAVSLGDGGRDVAAALEPRRGVLRTCWPADSFARVSIQPGEDAHVLFDDVHMSFDERAVLRGLTCRFPRGKITVILGGSGAGKTTILRLIGGLVRPQRGRVVVAGDDVSRLSEDRLYAVRAKLGMMFQGGALLNSLTIFDNLAFPLREHTRLDEAQVADEVRRTLAAVGLSGVDGLLPGQLSGGMIKRAALARALLMKPEILLCDEPFSGLDPISVKRIEALLHRLNEQLRVTVLISSHHIPSTMRLADQVLLLWNQRAATGTPQELRDSSDATIAEFFNEEVLDVPEDGTVRPGAVPARAAGVGTP